MALFQSIKTLAALCLSNNYAGFIHYPENETAILIQGFNDFLSLSTDNVLKASGGFYTERSFTVSSGVLLKQSDKCLVGYLL